MIISLKVTPSSGKQLIQWDEKQQLLKCYLKSAPEKSQANEELIKLFAKKLGIGSSFVAIIGGATGRRKKLSITTSLSEAEVYALLGVGSERGVRQQSIG